MQPNIAHPYSDLPQNSYKPWLTMRKLLTVLCILSICGVGVVQMLSVLIMDPFIFLGANVLWMVLWLAIGLGLLRWTPLHYLLPNRNFGWVALALMWGGGVSMLLVFASGDMSKIAYLLHLPDAAMSFGGAYPEEIIKLAGAVAIALACKEIKRPWHFFAVGMVVGLGFETMENMFYAAIGGLSDAQSDFHGLMDTWISRCIAGPWIHVALAGISSYAVGLAMSSSGWSTLRRWVVGFIGWFIAFILHFIFNLQIGDYYWVSIACASILAYACCAWIIYRSFHSIRRPTTWEFC